MLYTQFIDLKSFYRPDIPVKEEKAALAAIRPTDKKKISRPPLVYKTGEKTGGVVNMNGVPKMFTKMLVQSKIREVEMTKLVKQAGRTEVDLRSQLSTKSMEVRKLDSQLKRMTPKSSARDSTKSHSVEGEEDGKDETEQL